jgi:CheY-like chemotaxis protein
LNEVVGGVEKMLRRIIGEDVSLSTVLRPSAGFVRVDPGQIEQVIMNLAVNARDAMPQGGQLTIETGDVTFDTEYTTVHAESQPGHMSLLAISDTGVGMSREIQARIFEPFFTTKGHGRGTGLGLAVVHGIVKQSGGSVAVYSEPGRGTTIKVYFPMVEVEEEQSTADEAPRPGGGGETILLVEDEEGVRQMTAMALTALGYHVETACCGPEAIERIGEFSGRIDLLVTDVVMPEMSGRVLAEYLEERYPELKVLFVSGYTDDAVMRHGVLQSDVAFLQKPFTLSGLAQKVRDVLGSG